MSSSINKKIQAREWPINSGRSILRWMTTKLYYYRTKHGVCCFVRRHNHVAPTTTTPFRTKQYKIDSWRFFWSCKYVSWSSYVRESARLNEHWVKKTRSWIQLALLRSSRQWWRSKTGSFQTAPVLPQTEPCILKRFFVMFWSGI